MLFEMMKVQMTDYQKEAGLEGLVQEILIST